MPNHSTAPSDDVVDHIKAILGPGGWKDGAEAISYFDDPRGRFCGAAFLVVLPESTQQVSEIVSLCNREKIALIPYGGGTGVVAGQLSIETENMLILSLERMHSISEISEDDCTVTVQAGCILAHLHAAADEKGLQFPLSMASKGSCSIGGNLATNAGGIQVVRYGNTRDLCLGIEAVLPCGSILSDLSPLHKDNTGYDLKHLLIGSEGTLGVITAATFKLTPLDPETVTMLCAVASPAAALALYKKLRLDLRESISALELMSDFGLELVASCFSDLKKPFEQDHSWYVLIEAGGAKGITDQALDAMAACLKTGLVQDAVIAQSDTQRATLWRLRENTPEANRLSGAFVSSDTSVPISKVEAFIHATCAAVKAINPDLRVNTYGHIGDGNIHHNILPPQGVTKAAFLKAEPDAAERIRMVINDATVQFGGSISAEHGIGRLKTQDLEAYVSPVKQRALKAIKLALDPNNIMNPGAVLR